MKAYVVVNLSCDLELASLIFLSNQPKEHFGEQRQKGVL